MSGYINNQVVENNLNHGSWAPGTTPVVVSAGTLALTVLSTTLQVFTGSTAGQVVKLPDCTTLINDTAALIGWLYTLYNDSSVNIAVEDNSANALFTLNPGQRAEIICVDVADAAGQWTWQVSDKNSLKYKAGVVAFGSFAGNPKKAAVVFAEAFGDTSYSIQITTGDARMVTYEAKLATGFTINLNANQAPTAAVQWMVMHNGES